MVWTRTPWRSTSPGSRSGSPRCARDHEFTFLDHALKCGDSLVGLSAEQIEAVHWQPGANLTITEGIVRHALEAIERERNRIREAADDAGEAELRPLLRRAEQALIRPKAIGDAVIAAFFKGSRPTEREAARIDVLEPIEHNAHDWFERIRALTAGLPVRPFHWQLEFPEVFDRPNGGFDAIVGNPPFLWRSAHEGDARRNVPGWCRNDAGRPKGRTASSTG